MPKMMCMLTPATPPSRPPKSYAWKCSINKVTQNGNFAVFYGGGLHIYVNINTLQLLPKKQTNPESFNNAHGTKKWGGE